MEPTTKFSARSALGWVSALLPLLSLVGLEGLQGCATPNAARTAEGDETPELAFDLIGSLGLRMRVEAESDESPGEGARRGAVVVEHHPLSESQTLSDVGRALRHPSVQLGWPLETRETHLDGRPALELVHRLGTRPVRAGTPGDVGAAGGLLATAVDRAGYAEDRPTGQVREATVLRLTLLVESRDELDRVTLHRITVPVCGERGLEHARVVAAEVVRSHLLLSARPSQP